MDSLLELHDCVSMGLSCSACGFKSENRAFFRLEKTASLGIDRWFCIGCKPLPKARIGFVALGFFIALALAGSLITAISPGLDQYGYVMALFGGLIAFRPLIVAAHEGGHAAAAAALGMRLYRVEIGTGAPFKTTRIGKTQLVIGRDMAAGLTTALPLGRESPWRRSIFLAAGPLGSAASAAFLILLAGAIGAVEGPPTTWSGAVICFLYGGTFASLFSAVFSMWPRYSTIDGSRYASDGLQLLRLFRRQRQQPDWEHLHNVYKGADLLETKRWREAEDHYRRMFSKHSDQPSYLAAQMHASALADGPEAAMACVLEHREYLRTSHPDESQAPSWASVWGNAAWAIVRSPNGDLALAEEFASRAVEADATSPYSGPVRAAVLVRSGQGVDSLDVILGSFKDMGGPSDKLEFCDFIIAEGLESANLKRADFESYAAHLRTLA